MPESIAACLRRLDAPGRFSAFHRELGHGLAIEVDGVGRVELPVSAADAEALIAAATRSPFGYGEETRHDRSVRDSWEIPGERVHLDPATWSARFERGVAQVVESLGLPADGTVTPRLHKLLIYGPGQFFAPHRDTEKTAATLATLVVLLPGEYRGGELVVSHGGRSETYDTATYAANGRLGFVGLYADCVHETKPVTRGHRVALTYALELGGDPGSTDALPSADVHAELQRLVARHFQHAPPAGGHDDDGHWLVVLLDHEYAPQSLDWSRLKNDDRVRVAALREIADAIDCDCFLAIADVHETYSIDEEGRDGEFQGPPPGGFVDLEAMEVTLERWTDAEGSPCAGTDETADHESVVTTLDAEQRAAYDQTWSPWTGNEGGHAEQCYTQAALVLVARGSSFHAEIAAPTGDAASSPSTRSPARGVVVRRRKK